MSDKVKVKNTSDEVWRGYDGDEVVVIEPGEEVEVSSDLAAHLKDVLPARKQQTAAEKKAAAAAEKKAAEEAAAEEKKAAEAAK